MGRNHKDIIGVRVNNVVVGSVRRSVSKLFKFVKSYPAAAVVAAIFIPLSSALIHRSNVSNSIQEVDTVSPVDQQTTSFTEEVKSNELGEQAVAPESATEATSESVTPPSSSSSVKVMSSVSSNSNNSSSTNETTVDYSSVDGTKTQTIVSESEDGDSSVKFNFQVSSDADVEIRERNGRLRININEETDR